MPAAKRGGIDGVRAPLENPVFRIFTSLFKYKGEYLDEKQRKF